ncbi:OpgC domain-containing protein [Bradyrhizobium sp. LMG 9283]|uniref:OpgC domain-containing protein n=1 Tax=Bradyrhizobium sp. LMG 9283 TaxID=592064 RepID=UPI00388EDD2A
MKRDLRIDLFRGLSLWWIYINRIPENYLNRFTPKNFGFSDAAEILVFLSGLVSGCVYGDLLRRGAAPVNFPSADPQPQSLNGAGRGAAP